MKTVESVCATRDSEEDARAEAMRLSLEHPDRAYGVIETRALFDPPRTVNRWCVMERR